MRFLITATEEGEASAKTDQPFDDRSWALRYPVGIGNADLLEICEMTELSDLPPNLQGIIRAAAPTWSSKLWR